MKISINQERKMENYKQHMFPALVRQGLLDFKQCLQSYTPRACAYNDTVSTVIGICITTAYRVWKFDHVEFGSDLCNLKCVPCDF